MKELLMSNSIKLPSGCREWTGRRHSCGYGLINGQGRSTVYAHRKAFEIFKGPIPERHEVCHSCDNTACIEPDHLFSGTHAENMADMLAKGRHVSPFKSNTAPVTAKLSTRQVLMIRRDSRSSKELAETLGVGRHAIARIRSRKTYSWIQ